MKPFPRIEALNVRAALFVWALVFALCLPAAGLAQDREAGQPAFRRAEGQRPWRFPEDHGQHPAYRLEWWYITGTLATDGGRRFGYQVTFFRQGVTPTQPRRPSRWGVRSLYLAHVALSDVETGSFLRDERLSRDSLELAGAAEKRLNVWLGPWRMDPLADDPHGARIRVDAESFRLDLTLRALKPPVLHGEGGLDAKGPLPGQASWYYSLPRLATEGTVVLHGKPHAVRGESWMDHEFGSGQLAPELAGWDWLALRLGNGRDLMLYRLRTRDGGTAPYSGGSLVATDGSHVPIRLGDGSGDSLILREGRVWVSPATGGRYPVAWEVLWPREDMHLRVEPVFDAQENPPGPGTPFAYWEGMVRVVGKDAGQEVTGEGYLEMTGYAGELGGALRGDPPAESSR